MQHTDKYVTESIIKQNWHTCQGLLKEKNINYELIEITEDTTSMKEFLKLRDNLNEFAKVRQRSTIGVPFFVFDDGKMTFDVDEAIEHYKK